MTRCSIIRCQFSKVGRKSETLIVSPERISLCVQSINLLLLVQTWDYVVSRGPKEIIRNGLSYLKWQLREYGQDTGTNRASFDGIMPCLNSSIAAIPSSFPSPKSRADWGDVPTPAAKLCHYG